MKSKLVVLLACVAALGFVGCESIKNAVSRPETGAVLEGAKQAAFAATYAGAAEAARQVAAGQKLDGGKVAMVSGAAALYTAANYVRQLQATPAVLNERATGLQLAAAGIPPAEAASLAEEITFTAKRLAAKGIPPDEASEINAAAFDAAAKAIEEGKR